MYLSEMKYLITVLTYVDIRSKEITGWPVLTLAYVLVTEYSIKHEDPTPEHTFLKFCNIYDPASNQIPYILQNKTKTIKQQQQQSNKKHKNNKTFVLVLSKL